MKQTGVGGAQGRGKDSRGGGEGGASETLFNLHVQHNLLQFSFAFSMDNIQKLQECSLGVYLKEECHKVSLCRLKGFIVFKDLAEDQRELLIWRSGVQNLSKEDKICFYHEKFFLARYESLQTSCADPYNKHTKQCKRKFLP